MKLDVYLQRHGISLGEIERLLRSRLEIGPGDAVFLAGSLLEDLGNENSDLDALLLSDRPPRGAADEGLIHMSSRPHMDVEWWSVARLERLLARLEAMPAEEERDPASAVGVADGELQLLHRLRTGRPLLGAEIFDRLQRRVAVRHLARLLFDRALIAVRAHQVDVDGFLRDGDPESALLQCNEMLGYLADALLAATGSTQTSRKWRSRRLRALVAEGMREIDLPGGPLRLSVLEGLLHGGSSRRPLAVRQRAHRFVHLANRLLPWGQAVFLGPPSADLAPLPSACGGADLPLGDLVLDAQVERRGGRLRLVRFRTDQEVLLDETLHEALLCFGRRQPAGRAARHLARHLAVPAAEALALLLALRSRLEEAGFLASPEDDLR